MLLIVIYEVLNVCATLMMTVMLVSYLVVARHLKYFGRNKHNRPDLSCLVGFGCLYVKFSKLFLNALL